jgi:hypothetical protein
MSDAMHTANPYAAPTAPLTDRQTLGAGEFIENGRRVPASHAAGWLSAAWQLYFSAPFFWTLMWVIAIVMTVVIGFVPFIGKLINLFLQPALLAGMMLACHDAEEGETVKIGQLFGAFRSHAGPIALLAVLALALWVGIAIIVGIVFALAFGGLAGLGLSGSGNPGPVMWLPVLAIGVVACVPVLLLAVAMFLAPALIVVQDLPALTALRMGFVASWRNVLGLLLLALIGLVLAALASLPIFLGWLVLGPWMTIVVYTLFRDVFYE